MTDLLSKLAGAERGSRELSDEVLLALGWKKDIEYWEGRHGPMTIWTMPDNADHILKIPSPTESVDDCLALMPDGWSCNAIFGVPDILDLVELWNGKFAPHSIERKAEGKTPSLAFSAALVQAHTNAKDGEK